MKPGEYVLNVKVISTPQAPVDQGILRAKNRWPGRGPKEAPRSPNQAPEVTVEMRLSLERTH